ncbi:Ig-like domain-containing protein [Cellulomonas bogoriensis]|uniref:Fibronectin n=1 Tax=Cellulomonas bogoriensis 69B4 = DSM 16987 TaxID=1386082 RepID=A0A0A0BXR0_9CELL|nr:Ig-like domain-containing protein [Cellulomonas bogoriensis]KGM11969.1 fibronectin [Cellulomonas bogoriensis 69B4 = DSM 16987]
MADVVQAQVRRSRWEWTRLGAAVTVPAVAAALAVIYPGAPVSQVDLHDGTVWLTNTTAAKLGRYNPQVDELNGGLVAGTSDFDVLQDAGDVLLTEPGWVSVVDPASVVLAAQAAVPLGARVTMGSGTVAVSDPGSGAVWARGVDHVGTMGEADPDLELGEGGVAVATHGGAVVAAGTDGALQRLEVQGEQVSVSESGRLSGLDQAPTGFDQVTSVGEDLVVLHGSRLSTPRGSVDLGADGTDVVLQQPGPRASHVLVATTSALLEVPLDGGQVREHESGGEGRPAAPVRVGSCVHGAWATATGSYVQVCDGEVERKDLMGMSASDELVFRVNRDVVVLNDTLRGRLWVPLEDPRLREPNWQDIEPEEETEEDEEEAESRQNVQNLQAECTASSGSPVAVDDEFGVRPGRTRILPVIDNDSSSDCGILTISEFDPIPEDFGSIVPVHGGRALQLTAASGASGSVEFTYTIADGRGSTAPSTASVVLTVREEGLNEAPVQSRVGTVLVEQGASVTYDVLADFHDPDGDHLVLVDASVDGGGTVRTRQDGELTFTSDGGALGRQVARVTVSDGWESVEGTVNVDVRPAGSLAPVIDPVHAETYVDQPVTVRPLRSVRSASREPVRLAGVDELPDATVTTDLGEGTFQFTAPRAGTYYVTFMVAASPQQATGLARIDVREVPEEPLPPVAVMDVALLPPGGEVTINPLANDMDPAGGVLVLQSVEVPDGSGLQAAVLNHELVRFTSMRVLSAPVVATYTISNGSVSVTGEILVQPVPATVGQQAPVVPNVTASVRTGGVVTIPVLEGAYDPDGDALALDTDLAEPLGAGEGLLFVSGDVLRYQAPATPMQVHATFTVSDAVGNRTAATLTVNVHESDVERKALPRPKNLTARVFEGETVRIPVPLVGVDPDGDGVSLLGQDQAPAKGRILDVGPDWLEYEALPGELGTDTFTYAVEDWVGQRAVATVRVGISPRPTGSAQVIARNDDVTVRPGQMVQVRVLRNDVDASGGELTLEPDLDLEEGVEAHVDGRRVVVQTPREPGVLQIGYTATNDRGGRGSAVLTVTVDGDAPILPPVARDVVVPAIDTINRSSVEVDVLEVADNPSGPMSELEARVHATAQDVATVTERGTILVQLVDRAQTLPFLVRNTHPDADGIASYAFITVPALGDFPPVRRPRAPELRVVAGEQLVIPLEEQVQVGPGRTARIADVSRVSATKSDGGDLVADARTLQFTAERGYAGPAAISVEVTDGVPGETSSRRSVISLPITVLAAEAHPPTFSPSVLDVGPGESTRVDLGVFTSTPVGTSDGTTRYAYRLTSEPPRGYVATLVDGVLTIEAPPTAPRGTVGGVGIEIDYGGAERVQGQVDFRVVASSRRLARVNDHVIREGVEGVATTVPVLNGAYNPFPGDPLTVVDVVVESGTGDASVVGSQVVVRPASGFIGDMVARYRVRDVTRDPDREVEGRVRVTVRGRPDAPRAPRVNEVRDRTVVLSWDAPASNGEPITGYRVTTQPGGAVRECASTTCTIDRLTNDTEYTFTVAARNAVDWSEASPASSKARPDAVPAAPGSLVLEHGDGRIDARWAPAASTGSPITAYTVEISPSNLRGQSSFTTQSTSLAIGNLQNGTSYQVRVRAQNRAPDPGPWSGWVSEIPARAPDAPTVTAERVDDQLGRQIQVRWTPGSSNGDSIRDYTITIRGNGSTRTVEGHTGTSFRMENAVNGVPYQFEIRARNKAGLGAAGTARASAFGVPDAPTGMGASASRDSAADRGTMDVTWNDAVDNGSPVTHHRVQVNGEESTLDRRRTGLSLSGLRGGDQVVVRVQACNVAGCSKWGEAASATPVTRPGAVTGVTFGPAERDGNDRPTRIDVSWSAPGDWGGEGGRGFRYRCIVDGDRQSWVSRNESQTSGRCDDLPRLGFLKRSMTVQVEVEALTRVGNGPPSLSETVTLTRASEPHPVRDVRVSVPSDLVRVDVSWQPPTDNGGAAVESYVVQLNLGEGWTTIARQSHRSLQHELRPGEVTGDQLVRVRVAAVNSVGQSEWVTEQVRTPRQPDPPPDPEPDG